MGVKVCVCVCVDMLLRIVVGVCMCVDGNDHVKVGRCTCAHVLRVSVCMDIYVGEALYVVVSVFICTYT
jgi:hypothetical protein